MGALKLFRFCNEEQPMFYYYNVDKNLDKLEVVQGGIPTYIGYPKKEFAKNSFANLILSTPLVDLESLILKHLRLLAINDINKEREVLFSMKRMIDAYTSTQLLFLLSPFNIIPWIYYRLKDKNHLEEFNRIIANRLNFLSNAEFNEFEMSSQSDSFKIELPDQKIIRLIHEFDQILRVNEVKYHCKPFEFRLKVAKLIKLNVLDPDNEISIIDSKGKWKEIFKKTEPKNWLVMKGLLEIISK